MEGFFSILALFVGFISCLIIGVFLGKNHLTRIIEIIIGAAQYYVLIYLGIGPSGVLAWLVIGSLILIPFAVVFAVYEVWCLITFVFGLDTSSKPSPNSQIAGELANLIMLLFRR